ncbi:MAG: HAMP domain-containing histidine kinase [Cellvibrionaceae bacterium]|nr:HAMP domain-containing histidine kinase [Cellvibrionaceae bacterium]
MALLFTVLCGAVAMSLGYFINYFAKGHFVQSTQAVIDSEIKYLDALGAIPDKKHNPGRLYVLLGPHGKLPENFPQPAKFFTEGLLVFQLSETRQRYAARIHTLKEHHKLLVGVDITAMAENFDFMQGIGVASIVFVMVVVFVSFVISVFVVDGTNKIAETAQKIIHTGDLSRRIEMKFRWDDLGNLANVLNALLDRVEELMRGVREVSDNIAHDLRTPLTRMRSHIEHLQKLQPENPGITKLLQEADQILNTFAALLRISRIETEQQRSQFTALALDQLLFDVLEFYEPLAEEKNIQLSRHLQPTPIHGDRDLLFQAFANVLDNAVKYTPAGGWINISATRRDERNVISIENSAEPFTLSELDKLFQRFYRADKSRSQPGSGLGLSLVAAVVSLHSGQVKAESYKGGLRIITIL